MQPATLRGFALVVLGLVCACDVVESQGRRAQWSHSFEPRGVLHFRAVAGRDRRLHLVELGPPLAVGDRPLHVETFGSEGRVPSASRSASLLRGAAPEPFTGPDGRLWLRTSLEQPAGFKGWIVHRIPAEGELETIARFDDAHALRQAVLADGRLMVAGLVDGTLQTWIVDPDEASKNPRPLATLHGVLERIQGDYRLLAAPSGGFIIVDQFGDHDPAGVEGPRALRQEMIRFDDQGREEWSRSLDLEFAASVTDVAVDASGDIVIIGMSGELDEEAFVLRYDEHGGLRWRETRDGGPIELGQYQSPDAVELDAEGRMYLLSTFAPDSSSARELQLMAITPDGRREWTESVGAGWTPRGLVLREWGVITVASRDDRRGREGRVVAYDLD